MREMARNDKLFQKSYWVVDKTSLVLDRIYMIIRI